jgi:hypothetical protein
MVIIPGTLRTRSLLRATPWQRAHTATATAGEAPRWRQARPTTATATATAGEAPRGNDERRDNNRNGYVKGEGGRGEGNCGGGGSGGDNCDGNDGIDDNDNNGIDDSDDGGDDKDDDVSDDDHNGGNGGGGCNTATAVGIDRQVNNQLKAAIDTGRGRPRGAVEAMASGAMVHHCEFFYFAFFAKNVGCSEKFFSPPKEQDPVFNLDSLI